MTGTSKENAAAAVLTVELRKLREDAGAPSFDLTVTWLRDWVTDPTPKGTMQGWFAREPSRPMKRDDLMKVVYYLTLRAEKRTGRLAGPESKARSSAFDDSAGNGRIWNFPTWLIRSARDGSTAPRKKSPPTPRPWPPSAEAEWTKLWQDAEDESKENTRRRKAELRARATRPTGEAAGADEAPDPGRTAEPVDARSPGRTPEPVDAPSPGRTPEPVDVPTPGATSMSGTMSNPEAADGEPTPSPPTSVAATAPPTDPEPGDHSSHRRRRPRSAITAVAAAVIIAVVASWLWLQRPPAGTERTAVGSTAPLSVILVTPQSQSTVPACLALSGTVSGLPDDSALWLAIRPQGGHFQAIRPSVGSDGVWHVSTRIRSQAEGQPDAPSDAGHTYGLYAAVVPDDLDAFLDSATVQPVPLDPDEAGAGYRVWTALPADSASEPFATLTRSGVDADGCT